MGIPTKPPPTHTFSTSKHSKMAATMISRTSVRAPVAAAKLSSRSAVAAPIMCVPKVASAPGMDRVISLVCQGNAEKAMQAVRETKLPSATKTAVAVAVSNVMMASPAHAGVLFDFNLTLPIIAGQFLALMFILDKVVFSPIGEILDKRDGELREKLMAVKDNAGDLDALAAEAAAIISSARQDATAAIKKAKEETDAVCNEKVGAAKAKLDGELKVALTTLESQKADAMSSLEATAETLASEIEEKILPA